MSDRLSRYEFWNFISSEGRKTGDPCHMNGRMIMDEGCDDLKDHSIDEVFRLGSFVE
jgi:hypothetical protein